ncbi:MAG: flagellar filament capping protein FliD [Acidimicrobiales bacterium]
MSNIGSTTPGTGGLYSPGGASPPLYVNGLISGINTDQVIQALMQSVEAPQSRLKSQQSQLAGQISDYQQLNSDLSALQSAAEALSAPSAWQAVAATSSDPSAVGATSSGSGLPGSISFNVNQLAQADTLASSGTVASASDVVASGDFLVSAGGGALGLGALQTGSGLALGSHTVDVTQALTGATTSGSTNLAASTTITTGTNDTIVANVGGTGHTFTLAAGTYDPAQLAAEVQSASGGLLQAEVGGNGQLQVSTTQLGSAASLQVTGGSALASLGLSAMGSAAAGSNGSVTVDGTVNALTSGSAGSTVSLTSGSGGTITATLGAFGTSGTLSADNVSTGDGSLSSVVGAINAAGLGVSAAAVQTGANAYRLQLSATKTGAAADLSVATNVFAPLGALGTVVAGQDAQLQVGGSSGYTVTSATNTVSNLLPGLDLTLTQATTSPVTVTLAPDASGIATKVSSLVTAANTALSDINSYAGYDATTKQAGPLMGDGTVSAITQQVLSAVADAVGGADGSGGLLTSDVAGLTVTSGGQLSFDSSKFTAAFATNPSGVAALFGQGGTFSPKSPGYAGQVSFVYANDNSAAGSYDVQVSQSASQATDLGSTLFASGATMTAGETVTVSVGSASASYTTVSGDTLASVVSGLNQALASAGLGVTAQVATNGSNQQLELASAAYGSNATFGVTTTGTDQFGLQTGSPVTGTDVAGTIDGVAATGSGQVLTAPRTGSAPAGLSLLVTATGISSLTDLGTFTYTPGVAGQLAAAGYVAADPTTGNLTTTIQNLQSQSSSLGTQISAYDPIIAAQQQAYRNEFAQMEAQLATLKSQSGWLSAQLGQLPSAPTIP